MASLREKAEASLFRIPFMRGPILKVDEYLQSSRYLTSKEVSQCENDPEKMDRILSAHWKRNIKYFKSVPRQVDDILKSSPEYADRKDKDELRKKMLLFCFGYGFQPEEFVVYELENKTQEQRNEFLSRREGVKWIKRMNDLHDIWFFHDKGKTYELFKPFFKRDAVYLNGQSDYNAFCEYVKRHPVFVKKEVSRSMGRGISLVNIDKSEMTREQFFNEMMGRGPHLLEECVQQSEDMAVFNSSSVNTVRCMTFNTKHGIETRFCFLKTGRNGSFVDNGGAGGILIGIDDKTGKLNTDGYDEMNNRYECHPDSGARYMGYQLPDWEQLLSLCKEMAKVLPSVKYIGWDLAHTKDGWVLIEGNGRGMFIGPQTVYKNGIRAEVEALMKDMELNA